MKTKEQTKTNDVELTLNAMNVYLQEYIHRDNHMWSQNYRLFFSTLIVILTPNLTTGLGIELPELLKKHSYIFPIVGIFLALIFLYISLSLAKRFNSVSKTYNKLILTLPEDLQRVKLDELPVKMLNYPAAYLITFILFFALIAIAILSLISC